MSPFLWRHRPRLSDREIELLLTGSPEASDEHADLKWFLTVLADHRPEPPHDAEHMASALASVARSSVPGGLRARRTTAARRIAAVAASFALLFTMSGIGLAADGSAPGDLLYGIDQAFELIGIGDGGVDERIAEFDALINRGDEEAAYEFLEEVIESSRQDESTQTQEHLPVVTDGRAGGAEDNTVEHQRFIEQNKKDGVGADRREFGRGVADIVRIPDQDLPERAAGIKPDTPASNDNETGPPHGAGRPDDVGPPAESRSRPNPQNQSKGNLNTGAPDSVGKPDK